MDRLASAERALAGPDFGTYPPRRARRGRVALLAVLLLALVIALGVLFQARLRGGDTPEDVARRYVDATRSGDRIGVVMLTYPDRPVAHDADRAAETYRTVTPERIATTVIRHDPAYLLTARIFIDGRATEELVLQHIGGRWYLVRVITP